LSDREKGREVELEHEEIEATIWFPSAVIDELTNASTQTKSTKKMKKNNIEVSNPKASGADNNDELVTTMKNSRYSQNQRKNLQRLSYHPSSLLPIQADLSLYVNESTTDALLVRCFQIRKEGQKNYSQNCVHHGLLSQYCWKVGWDDVTLFLCNTPAW
ncbi:hypothetical protein KEM48_006825, partial [Puccinia striiformis f. sp. tritici PST-130]